MGPNLPTGSTPPKRRYWKPKFFSQTFLRSNKDITCDKFALTSDKLYKLGEDVSKLRKMFLEEAVNQAKLEGNADGASPEDIEEVVKRIKYRSSTREPKHEGMHARYFLRTIPPGRQRRLKKRGPLSLEDKVAIIYKIVIDKEKLKDVAKEFRISQSLASIYVKKAKDKPDMLAELQEK